jgi:hypothetical protein
MPVNFSTVPYASLSRVKNVSSAQSSSCVSNRNGPPSVSSVSPNRSVIDDGVIEIAEKTVDHHLAAAAVSEVGAQSGRARLPITHVSRYGLTWPAVIGGPCRGSGPRGRSSRLGGEYVNKGPCQ